MSHKVLHTILTERKLPDVARRRGPPDSCFPPTPFGLRRTGRGNDTALSIYIHWPYCVSKCPYCDFNSQKIGNVDSAEWLAAYLREMEHYARLLSGRQVGSVYFGGGTPSLMSSSIVAGVLECVSHLWKLTDDVEITLEANPSSAEAEKFSAFRAAGVNRLSLGVQSLRDEALQFLGRAHDALEARAALELAAKIFPRFSFDLIYARAGQTGDAWEAELREALAFGAKHMSLYQLTIEEGTVFYKQAERFKNNKFTPPPAKTKALLRKAKFSLPPPQGGRRSTRESCDFVAPEEDAAAMYEMTLEIMETAGVAQYEISNFAAAGEESRHNLTYWRYDDYIGVGPGAHGRFVCDGARHAMENHRSPDAWMKQVAEQGQGQCADEVLDLATAQREALMMGLRLAAGIDLKDWEEKFGVALLPFLPEARLAKLCRDDLCVVDGRCLRATKEGLQRLDAVLGYLLA